MIIKHRKQNRLKGYDYSQNGYYFVTICIHKRRYVFGEIKNNKMILNIYGKMAKQCWLDIPKHFPNVELDEFVIMPNHVHGIIVICNKNASVGNAYMRSLQTEMNDCRYRTKMMLSKIIHEYKSAVSRFIHKFNSSFKWQKSYYDHVIRNNYSLFYICQYIRDNPMNWEEDRNSI